MQAACHCSDCQHQTGSPFTVFIGVPDAAFAVEGDTLTTFKTTGEDHGGETERSFCSVCGAPVFSISPLAPGVTLIKAGSLDDASWLTPQAEFFMTSAQPWAPHFDQAASFERGPA
jgi:hypothetical protein